MNIAIDCRFWGTKHKGLGRYTTNVVMGLIEKGKGHKYHLIIDSEYAKEVDFPDNVSLVPCDIPHYSFQEQITLPALVSSLNVDLLHTMHLNVPVLMTTPTVVTIHDLIKSHFKGKDTTTRPTPLFFVKRIGYNIALQASVRRSKHIIVPSNFVRNDIINTLKVKQDKITVVHEAPDEVFTRSLTADEKEEARDGLVKYDLPKNYVLYVGNAYPHKNLETLVKAMEHVKEDTKLVIVSKDNIFMKRIKSSLTNEEKRRLVHINYVSDFELHELYSGALATVSASFMEGFGLPGLESLAVGTPIVVSDIPVFHEVYGENAVYADPRSPEDFGKKINETISSKSKNYKIQRSWGDAAEEILKIYDKISTSIR